MLPREEIRVSKSLELLLCILASLLANILKGLLHYVPAPFIFLVQLLYLSMQLLMDETLVKGPCTVHLHDSRDGSLSSCSTSLQHLRVTYLPSFIKHSAPDFQEATPLVPPLTSPSSAPLPPPFPQFSL